MINQFNKLENWDGERGSHLPEVTPPEHHTAGIWTMIVDFTIFCNCFLFSARNGTRIPVFQELMLGINMLAGVSITYKAEQTT